MDEIPRLKAGDTRHRWLTAIKDKAFDSIRDLVVLETQAEHFLKVLKSGSVSTNIYLRRIHNFALETTNAEARPIGEPKPMLRSVGPSVWIKSSSMIASSSQDGHSVQVKMRLLVNGGSIAVDQMRPEFLLVDAPFDHPPGNASLMLQVDQSECRRDVHPPEGVAAGSRRDAITAINQPRCRRFPVRRRVVSLYLR